MGDASVRLVLVAACASALRGIVTVTVNGRQTGIPVDTPTLATDAVTAALDGAGIAWVEVDATVAEPEPEADTKPESGPKVEPPKTVADKA